MEILETERLRVRWLNAGDAPFILELLNDPDWLHYIGDRGVRNLIDARTYISEGPVVMYEQKLGFGFERMIRLEEGGKDLRLYATGWSLTQMPPGALARRQGLTDNRRNFHAETQRRRDAENTNVGAPSGAIP